MPTKRSHKIIEHMLHAPATTTHRPQVNAIGVELIGIFLGRLGVGVFCFESITTQNLKPKAEHMSAMEDYFYGTSAGKLELELTSLV